MNPDELRRQAGKPRTDMRRKDRAMDEEEIIVMLEGGRYGVLATTHGGQPYATPVNYVYLPEDHALYFHGALIGRTRANLALNPQVCFNVSEMGALVPGEKSSGFGADYRSVTVFGKAEGVSDEERAADVLLALMRKYFPDHRPGEDYSLPEADEIKRTAVYRIAIEEWSGKYRRHANEK